MPTKAKVSKKVKSDVAEYANYPLSKIKDSQELKKNPLKMDTPKLNYLTLSLRAYIKKHNSKQTLLAKEIKKSKFTVKKLVDLVYKKITG